MADKRGKTSRKPSKLFEGWNREAYRNTELTIRAKGNIMKHIEDRATSWSCHFKKRYLGDPVRSKLILQIGF